MCRERVEKITIFGFSDFFIFHIVQSIKMLVVDVFDVNPLNEKESFEFK